MDEDDSGPRTIQPISSRLPRQLRRVGKGVTDEEALADLSATYEINEGLWI